MAEKKPIILTGCAGFVGANIAQRLLLLDYDVFGYDNLSFGYERNVPKGVAFFKRPFSGIFDEAIMISDTIIHAATHNLIFAMENPMHVIYNNAVDTLEFFNRIPKEKKIIYLSTASIYGNAKQIPTPETAEIDLDNSYDTSKYIAELYLRSRGNYTTLRLSNVYEELQRPEHKYSGVIGKLIGQALYNQPLTVIGGEQTRDYTYVDDVVDAVILAIEQNAKNKELNIATQVETRLVDLVGVICREIYKKDTNLITQSDVDKWITKIPERSIDRINRRCLLIEKAKYELGWIPKTSLIDGIRKTILWQLKEYPAR